MSNTDIQFEKVSLDIDRNVHEILKNKITESFSCFFENALRYIDKQFLHKDSPTQWKDPKFIQEIRRACDKVYFNRIKVEVFIPKELIPKIDEARKWINPKVNFPNYVGVLFIIDEYCLERPARFSPTYYFLERIT